MVTLDDSKELLIYKRPFILPIDPKNKKKGSVVILLSPNYESSKRSMTAPYLINRKYFESYYTEKSVYRYIKQEGSSIQNDNPGEYLIEKALNSKERKELNDSDFGLPKQRRYPMPDKKHVLSAIRFFNYVSEEDEYELASNIIDKIKKFDMASEVKVGKNNRFRPYWEKSGLMPVKESYEEIEEENDFLINTLYESKLDYINGKSIVSTNLVYSGYKDDIDKAPKALIFKSLKDAFKNLNYIYPNKKINVVISRSDANEEECITKDTVTFYTEKAMRDSKYGTNYDDYIKYIAQIFAIKYIQPIVSPLIYYPVATVLTHIADDEIKSNDSKYNLERIYKYILDVYGAETLKGIIIADDYTCIVRYEKELNKDEKYKKKNKYISESYKVEIPREAIALKEAEEEAGEENTAQAFDITIPQIGEVPESIKKIQNLATSLKRKMRAPSIYRLNKIGRDVASGNTGVEHRGEVNSLEQIRNGIINQFQPEGMFPEEESAINKATNGDYIVEGYVAYLFESNMTYDMYLRKALYEDRIKNNKELFALYKQVKTDMPFIKFAFIDLYRYADKNLFYDLSYYNETFYRNYEMNTNKGYNTKRMMEVYLELMTRLIKDDRLSNYKKKTFFIPVLDWHHNNSSRMWMYKEDINPISIIYDLLKSGNKILLRKLFGNSDVVFMGRHNYFKVRFTSEIFDKPFGMQKLVLLIKRLLTLGENGVDEDPEGEPLDSPTGIALDVIDKIEKAKGVEINNVSKIKDLSSINTIDTLNKTIRKHPEEAIKKEIIFNGEKRKSTPKNIVNVTAEENKKSIKPKNVSANRAVNAPDSDELGNAIVTAVVKAADQSIDTDDALNKLNTDTFKQMIEELGSESEDKVKINDSRASKMAQIESDFQNKEINGKSVKDLLQEDPNENIIKHTDLKVASINEEWKHVSFVNFDKDYNPDSDMIKMIDSMKNWTYPIVVRNIETSDNSNSEDILTLWKLDCEDSRGTKFTLKVDIPRFEGKSNFLRLRGNEKVLMIQSTLIPVLKTSDWECQVIGTGGYNKIFVRRVGGTRGRSMSTSNRLLKTINKYCLNNTDMKLEYGQNENICKKYNLPMDYIDLSTNLNTVSWGAYTFMFNQDELRLKYQIDDTKGIPIGIKKNSNTSESIIYYGPENKKDYPTLSSYITSFLLNNKAFAELYDSIIVSGGRFAYSQAGILSTKIPIIVVCGYLEGLIATMTKANIAYSFKEKLDPEDKRNDKIDYVKFLDGYLLYEVNYSSSLLMNGLKENDTESYSIREINRKQMYREFLENYGGSIKASGLENSYDCMIDPITKEILEYYKLPTDYVGVLIHANNLLADNKFIPHISQSARRWRRKELIPGYFYKALTNSYQEYANSMRNNRKATKMAMKQSAVIDLILSGDPSVSDLSINNAISDVESINTVTSKGLVGMNTDRAYVLSTRGYDESMLNLFGMDTGFSGNVGINRQASIDANVVTGRGLLSTINGDSNKLSDAKSLTVTEALTPFGSTHDDPQRTLMTFAQTCKHMVRCNIGDPTLVTNGADEALPHMVSDIFAFKAKMDGTVVEIVEEGFGKQNYMVIEYKDKTHDYIDLSEQIKKNSDGGYYVPLKLSTDLTVGSKVKGGDILAYDKLSFSDKMGESGNLSSIVGTLAKVAIINTDEGFEDSAAITESFAKRLSTDVIMPIETVIHKGSNISLLKNIGDNVMEGDTILNYQADFDDDVMNTLLKNLATDAGSISELGKHPIKSTYTGRLEGIDIYRTCELDEMSESLRSFVEKYERGIKKTKSVYNKYGIDTATLPATGVVEQVGKAKNVDDAVKIIFYIKYTDNMKCGDKITFYSANKGIVKYIISDKDAPYTEFRPKEKIDSFMSLSSISGRMTASIALFAAVSKLMVELDRSVKDLAGIPYNDDLA